MTAATSVFTVPSLRCAGCIAKLEGGLGKTAGVIDARVNFTTRRVRVAHADTLDGPALREAIERLGFPAEPFLGGEESLASSEQRTLARALGVAGFAAMNIMLLSVSIWSGAEGPTRQLFHWLSALIALPAVGYAGRPFFKSAWAALRRWRTNMDVPISIGVILTCAMSLYETIVGGRHAYFDGATMLLFFLLAGRFLDSVMRARAQSGVAALLRQTAPRALVIGKDGTSAWREANELAPGMTILVAAGENFAADGIVVSGRSSIDRSLVTGESLPEFVVIHSAVLAGTTNLDSPLTVKVTAAGPGTAIAAIARLIEAADGAKSRYVRVADRAARLYAPAVHSLAAASFAGWMIAGAGAHQSMLIAVAVLIITCPCALGLAVPVAQVVAAGALMRHGILIKDGSALERLAEADTALFDKTGTLTLGRPTATLPLDLPPDEAAMALALARSSRHPLSRALAAALEAQGVGAAELDQLVEQPGLGVSGRRGRATVRLGRLHWLGVDAAAGASLATAFQFDDGPVRILRFEDRLRPDAVGAITALRGLGFAPRLLSGDREEPVRVVADALGIEHRSGVTPAEKYDAIAAIQAGGHKVLMVGDGLNDGPALKAAHVSIAPSSASDVGQTAADLLFLGERLMPVAIAVAAARRTMRVVRQNFALAVGYNLLAVPVAMAGLATPLIAAIAMSGSSLIVVANALRLRACAR
ncbi:MAG: cadmium-translocating P-type ATPase [Sphingomonas bacterium]|nr:cadmium-translocating P-type ATPase [Sphingomonas bacterium]